MGRFDEVLLGARRLRAPTGQGFTLIEAMIALAILAILLALAVPSLRKFVLDNQRTSVVNDLIVSVQIARSEATRRGQRVAVCPANAAATACAKSQAFEGGWIVYAITATGPEVIRTFPPVSKISILGNAEQFIYPPPTDRLAETEPPNLSLWTITDVRGAKEVRFVDILPSGRPRTLCPNASDRPTQCA